MTNELAVSLKMPRRPVAKQVCCGGAIGTGGAGGGTAACGELDELTLLKGVAVFDVPVTLHFARDRWR